MEKMVKRNIYTAVFIIILIDAVIGYSLFKSRAFSHLAIWDIIESGNPDDFYWQPDNAPGYFHFEPDNGRIDVFKNEIRPLIRNKNDDFGIMLEAAKYVMGNFPNNNQRGSAEKCATSRHSERSPQGEAKNLDDDKILQSAVSLPQNDGNGILQQPQKIKALKWDSPEGMLRQIREGANGAHCFHRSILFSTYLSSLGIKSRLWALENDNFNAIAHTVNEVYIKDFKKWVFIDVMLNFYVTENGNPLSLLELRERLLNDKVGNILVQRIGDEVGEHNEIPIFYAKLIKCVFLRARNDFIDKYNTRYGFLSVFKNYIDKLPNSIRIGASYLFGGQNKFIHYADRFSKSLKSDIIITKALFYFLVWTIFLIGILCIAFVLVFLRDPPAINLSTKDTRQR